MKKTFKAILALALALVLCLSLSVAAFADDPVETDAAAYLTKELKMPVGTITPTTTFKFTATAVSVDGHTDRAATAPAATIADISFTSANTSTAASGVKSVVGSNPVTFGTFPHAGQYIYTVTETAATNTFADAGKQALTYSQAEYEMNVYVSNKTAGGLYIQSIVLYKVKDDSGTAVDPKVKVTAGEGGQFRFVNTYTEKSGPIDGDKYDSLKIEKIVDGNMGDRTLDFNFSLTITATALESATASYSYTKYLADGTTSTGTVTAGTATTFTLKHGEYIIVEDVLVGAGYTVSETNVDANYTVSAAAGVTGDTVTAATNTVAGTLVTAGNSATYTNTYSKDIPTGIVINNLPYVLLIAVATAGLVLYIVSKRRKEQEG